MVIQSKRNHNLKNIKICLLSSNVWQWINPFSSNGVHKGVFFSFFVIRNCGFSFSFFFWYDTCQPVVQVEQTLHILKLCKTRYIFKKTIIFGLFFNYFILIYFLGSGWVGGVVSWGNLQCSLRKFWYNRLSPVLT